MASDSRVACTGERQVTGQSGNPPGEGPFMVVHLFLLDGIVRRATYETYPCPACHDCGKAISAMVAGRSFEEARGITWEALVGRVGPLRRAQSHCYGLALLALSKALDQLKKDTSGGEPVEPRS